MMSTLPKSSLKLEWIYGYRGHQCRNNLVYAAENCIVYFVAGVGVVFDTKKQVQRFYLGHDDDIISLTIHSDNCHIATGQVGKSPQINVWNCGTLETEAILKDGHQHGISSLSFSRDGSKLLSVGSDPYSTLVLWEWKKGRVLSTTRGHSAKVFDARFTPNYLQTGNFFFVTCGMKHIKFWSHSGNTLTSKKGIFGKTGEIQTMMSLVFDEKPSNDLLTTLSVTLSGDIYIWKSERLNRVIKDIHKGAIYTIINYNDKFYATGGKDEKVKVLDSELNVKKTYDLSHLHSNDITVRSLYSNQEIQHNKILVGTKDSEIIELVASESQEISADHVLMQGHGEGELWALACHSHFFVTGSDDNTLRVWDKRTKKMKLMTKMDISIRSCAVNSDMSTIAIGLVDGSFAVLNAKDLKTIKRIKNRKEVIHEIKFSPNDMYLAVGSNDNFVDTYDCQNSFQKLGTCSGSSSFITHLDWSKDSQYIMTNSGAAESLIFNAPDGKLVTNSKQIEQITWESITCVLNNEIKGIWPKYSCTNDVNSCDTIRNSFDVVVTADDFGLVKLFKYPCEVKGAKFKKYTGHSAHVTNVRFTLDNQSVISVGGADHAIFQWSYISDKKYDEQKDFSESDENCDYTSKSKKTLIPVDSDVEKDNERNYDRPFDKNEILKMQKINRKKYNLTPPVKTPRSNKIIQEVASNQPKVDLNENQGPPDNSLQLEYVFGYRGFDGRNNVFYLKHNEQIVYHTAAIGVVMNLANKKQQFYLGHDDDILSLNIHPLKNIIATGQIGKNPPIHVWDGESLKTLSILKDHHSRGVCSLDFTKDGKKLASVGLDENHCIVVWDWKKGIKIAFTRGHKDLIYIVKWNPHDEDKLVTAGNKHIKFWSQTGNGFMSKRGVFGKVSEGETVLCVAYGKEPTSCFSGGVKGLVHCWGGKAGNVLLRVVQAHQGPIFSMYTTDGMVFTTSGKDKKINIWEKDFENQIKTINMDSFELNKNTGSLSDKRTMIVRSVLTRSNNSFVLIGTKDSDILEYNVHDGKVDVIVQGHEEGELWGLACHPSKMYIATTSEDSTLRIWSVGDKPGLISMKRLDRASRSVEFSPNGKLIAVGAIDGSVSIIEATSMTEKNRLKKRKQNISDIKFSPNPGNFMAVGSHDNFIDIYDVNNNFVCVGVCKGASSYITHIDWNFEGKLLQVNTGAKEILYYEAPRGNRVTPSQREAEAIDWVTWTSVLGPWCEGIWAPYSDITDVNSACLTKDKKLLATADDFGFVKLFSFPAKVKNAKHKKYIGHSAHVTNVRWCCDDRTLVSIGGADCSVLVWRLKEKSELKTIKSFYEGRSSEVSYKSQDADESKHNAFQNDESDSSDGDDGDEEGVGGYDSDIEKEIKIDYVPKFNVNPLRYINDKTLSKQNDEKDADRTSFGFKNELNGKNEHRIQSFFGRFKKMESKEDSNMNNNLFIESIKSMYSRKLKMISAEDKTSKTKFETLKLETIFGYRGYDSRNNVHYLDNEEVIYPAAATVVVLHLNTNQQRFYLGHNDDILCLATNQNPRFKYVIATGEIGHKPVVHVWNAKSMATLSILSGCLHDGVRIVDFSCSGKLLVAVGIDAGRTVVVYDWQEGIQLASSKSLSKPLYHLEYRPDSDRHFVSVGLRSIHFWTLVGNTLMCKKGDMTTYNGIMPSAPNFKMTFLSLAFGMNDVTYSGSITGDVYVWRGVSLERIVQGVHNGPVITMFTSLFDGLIVTGGKERNCHDCKNVKLWDQEMKKCMSFDVSKWNRKKLQLNQEIIVKSVSRIKGKIIVGTQSNKLIEIKENENEVRLVSSSHGDGELWGLSTHPRDPDVVASAGDDGLLFVWSLKNKKPLLNNVIGACRSLDYNSNGDWLAAGHVNGTFQILSTNKKYKSICEKRLRGSSVTVIKFTCDDNYIISACKDNYIDLYKINYDNNKNEDEDDESIVSSRIGSSDAENIDVYRVCSCDLKDAMAISIDVSNDSKCIKVGTVNYTNRYFILPNLTEVLIEAIPKVTFKEFTSLSDKEVKGTWPGNQKTNHHVNCCHVTSGKNHIVTGDDYGLVKLFGYPSSEENAKFEYMIGHSAHVTNIRFICNDLKVISLGGDDSCVFVWKCI